MKQIQSILVPTDFSVCAEQALLFAAQLAKRFNAKLHVLHSSPLYGEEQAGSEDNFPNRQKVIDALASEAWQADEITFYHKMCRQLDMSASRVILDYAEENDMDLVVMGTHGRGEMEHFFMGSVAESVIRDATCGVITVRQSDAPKHASDMTRILVPVDFTWHSEQALGFAMDFAALVGARVDLLYVHERRVLGSLVSAVGSSKGPDPEKVKTLKHQLELMAKKVNNQIPIEVTITQGRPSTKVLEHARKEHSDLIVMGTQGLTGITRMIIGSVTATVLRQSPCPVLSIKPDAEP